MRVDGAGDGSQRALAYLAKAGENTTLRFPIELRLTQAGHFAAYFVFIT
jgi:hypothetical protein